MAGHQRSRSRVDLASPLVLDIRELGRRAGSMRPVVREVDVVDRIGLELIAVPAGGVLALDLRMESVIEGVLVSGTVSGTATGECSRCLDPVEEDVTVRLVELFAYPDSTTEETTSDDEVRSIVDDHIDLTEAITDAVALELPLQPLCREDCPGLCAECGQQLATIAPGHGHERIDPRWAALASTFGPGEHAGDRPPSGSGTTVDQPGAQSTPTKIEE